MVDCQHGLNRSLSIIPVGTVGVFVVVGQCFWPVVVLPMPQILGIHHQSKAVKVYMEMLP